MSIFRMIPVTGAESNTCLSALSGTLPTGTSGRQGMLQYAVSCFPALLGLTHSCIPVQHRNFGIRADAQDHGTFP